MKKLYMYDSLDRVDPDSGAYHEGGALVVITSGYPNDVVAAGTGNEFEVDGQKRYGLPEADRVIVVPEDTEDGVFVYQDAGCC